MNLENMTEYMDAKLREMPWDLIEGAVEFLKKDIPAPVQEQIRVAHKKNPGGWWKLYHRFWGMHVRNRLREAGFSDERLPDNNWDDYYIQVVEIAVGVREMPETVE